MNFKPLNILTMCILFPAVSATASETLTFGPVVLHEGARFEVCANSKYASYNIDITASFVRLKNSKAKVREFRLDPGEGGCFKLTYEQAGNAPVFAALEVSGEPGDTNIVASAAVINGIFELTKPQLFIQDEGRPIATTFGPLKIPEGKRIEVCANNWKSEYASDITVNFYRAGNSLEPILTRERTLEPGEGGCASISQARVGKGAVFAELISWPVEPGFSNPKPVSGAFIINGLFEEPIPSQVRFLQFED